MNKKLLLVCKSYRKIIFTIVALGLSNLGVAQQVIGEFAVMDGGFEGQTLGPVTSSSVDAAKWTATNTGLAGTTGSGIKDIYNTVNGARSGNNFAVFSPATNQNARFTSPTTTAFAASTKYTVQYYAKSNVSPTTTSGGILGGAMYTNATTINASASQNPSTFVNANDWYKVSVTFTVTATIPTYAAVRFSASNSIGLTDLSVDDFVVYAGDTDVTAPDAPSSPTINGLNVSWSAPVSGVDGGGYVVVRYNTSPYVDNDPNQNGIYAVGNTIKNGTGSLVGTIVYVGTTTSFTDTVAGSVSGSDFYKVYAVDKAFNYSNEAANTLKVKQWNESKPAIIHPNPVVDNQISIEMSELNIGDIGVEIYDTLGRIVYKENIVAISNSIVVRPNQELKAGVYVVKLQSNGKSSTYKVIVK